VSDEKISLEYKLKRFFQGSLMSAEAAHVFWNGAFTEDEKSEFFLQNHECPLKEILERMPAGSGLNRYLMFDLQYYLPDDILCKVDRMSMAVSLEARVPLLDHKLIEFVCTRIPASMKMKGLETKHIFKRAVSELVPAEILNRPKQGFGVPIREWINRQLRERIRETLTEPRTMQRGYVEPRYVNLLLNEHERERRDHASELWALFMLELWHRQFVDMPHGVVLDEQLVQTLAPMVA